MPSTSVGTDDRPGFEADGGIGRQAVANGVSLLFAPTMRPSIDDIEASLTSGDAGAPVARVSHRPEQEAGWLELLSSGLTFDMSGLAPRKAVPLREFRHFYGFTEAPRLNGFEAVELVPSQHIAGGGAMLPVVRTLAGLAAGLALQLPVTGVAWHSAGTVMLPGYFARVVMNWLGGGAFPALGLAALEAADDGSIVSQGLAAFCGQEFQLAAAQEEGRADTVKLAIRVADHMVRHGPLMVPGPIEGAPGLFAEPSQIGRLVWIWRRG